MSFVVTAVVVSYLTSTKNDPYDPNLCIEFFQQKCYPKFLRDFFKLPPIPEKSEAALLRNENEAKTDIPLE